MNCRRHRQAPPCIWSSLPIHQSEMNPTATLHLVSASPPPATSKKSPESSSSAAVYMVTNPTATSSSSGTHLLFPSPSSTDHLPQIRSAPEAWPIAKQVAAPLLTSQHHLHHQQNSWDRLSPITYFSHPRRSTSYTKPRRSQILSVSCKRGGSATISSINGKGGLRSLREVREANFTMINGVGSPADRRGMEGGVNGSSAASTKKCRVCGDRAVNHNFGQLTCESCKAFFRRNAHKDLACTSKSGEHVVSPSTRRECPACRLKRCFLIGMRPDLIQVRKKDGTKPRWLDKYPAAAQVHERPVGHSEASKVSHLRQNSRSGESRHRNSYNFNYSRYTELKSEGFDAYSSGTCYTTPEPVTGPHALPPTSVSSQNNGGMYEQNGRGISALLGGEGNPASNCVVLTNPLADESAQQKGSLWNQSVINNVPISNFNWLQPQSGYPTSYFQNREMVLRDSFNSDYSFLSNQQLYERQALSSLDTYNGLLPTEIRSGASSGSATSPSVASSVPNFGSDTGRGSVDTIALKPATADWMTTEAEVGGVYLQNFSSKMFGSASSELRQSSLSFAGDQWFNHLSMSWRAAWRDGVFPNPSQVRLRMDLDSTPTEGTEDWRLTLANIWGDLLLRRVANFASCLFQPNGTKSYFDFNLSSALLEWMFKNRLVNCVPIILACALLRSSEEDETTSSPFSQSRNQQSEIADDGGSSPRSPRDCESAAGTTGYTSLLANNGGRVSTPALSVSFQVVPQRRVLISLSRLNAKLAENPTTAAYPMLQYLGAYVSELNKFLTDQNLLLGVYMAVKITEPPTSEELMQNPLSDGDLQQMHVFNVKFLHLFGLAADHVASSIVNEELSDSLQAQAKAMNDAICRRAKLPDFLNWSRQFDENMKSMLFDIWNISRHQTDAFISPGLAAFCSDSNQSSSNLVRLLSASTSDEVLEVV